jgi:DNA-binding MarR family transcriptional regulator
MASLLDPKTDPALAAELLERVGALRRGLRRAASSPWPGGELTGAQVELLRLLRREPGLSVREAAGRLRVAPNTVSTLVRQLGDAGLVGRERDGDDGRVARLVLTEEARQWLTAWRDERAGVLLGALGRLDARDRRALEAALAPLHRLTEALDGEDADV